MTIRNDPPPLRWFPYSVLCVGCGVLILGVEFDGVLRGVDDSLLFAETLPLGRWLTFLIGGAFLAASWGLWQQQLWVSRLALTLGLGFVMALVAYGIHVALGGYHHWRILSTLCGQAGIWLSIFSATRHN